MVSAEPPVKTALITGIGGDIGQGVATILREAHPRWRLVGTDVQERHGGGLFVDSLHRAPPCSDAGYETWLTRLVASERADICIPMSEPEIIWLTRRRLRDVAGVPLVMANAKAVEVGSDKLRTAEFLASIGVRGPWTIAAEQFTVDTELPCIFKARRSAGSKVVFECRTAADVEYYRGRYPDALLQERLTPVDREITCAVMRTRDGRIAVLPLLRQLVGGFSVWVQVIDDPAVREQCERIAVAVDLQGSINVQLRLTSAGPRIFEINPRFSSTVLMRHRLGFTDVLWSIADLLGRQVRFELPMVGAIAVRVQGASVMARGEKTQESDVV
jgi:carbamoyl-phosphate synthase large subunit